MSMNGFLHHLWMSFRLNFRSATEPLEDPLRLRWIRKDIARLKTILRERELESAR